MFCLLFVCLSIAFLLVLLLWHVGFRLVAANGCTSLVAVRSLLLVVTSLVAEHTQRCKIGFAVTGLGSRPQAQVVMVQGPRNRTATSGKWPRDSI